MHFQFSCCARESGRGDADPRFELDQSTARRENSHPLRVRCITGRPAMRTLALLVLIAALAPQTTATARKVLDSIPDAYWGSEPSEHIPSKSYSQLRVALPKLTPVARRDQPRRCTFRDAAVAPSRMPR